MEYESILREMERLDFIPDAETADAAVKAALGIFASTLEEDEARMFIDRLPEPLTMDKLYHHLRYPQRISPETYFEELSEQFSVSRDQAWEIAKTAIHATKEAVGNDVMTDLEGRITSDWCRFVEEA